MRGWAQALRACHALRFLWQLEDWWLAVYQQREVRLIGRSSGLRRQGMGLDGGTARYRRHGVSTFQDLRRFYERLRRRRDALRMSGSRGHVIQESGESFEGELPEIFHMARAAGVAETHLQQFDTCSAVVWVNGKYEAMWRVGRLLFGEHAGGHAAGFEAGDGSRENDGTAVGAKALEVQAAATAGSTVQRTGASLVPAHISTYSSSTSA